MMMNLLAEAIRHPEAGSVRRLITAQWGSRGRRPGPRRIQPAHPRLATVMSRVRSGSAVGARYGRCGEWEGMAGEGERGSHKIHPTTHIDTRSCPNSSLIVTRYDFQVTSTFEILTLE